MNEEQRCILDFLKSVFDVRTDREVFRRACEEQMGQGSLDSAELDYRLFEGENGKYLPPYVQASYDAHTKR